MCTVDLSQNIQNYFNKNYYFLPVSRGDLGISLIRSNPLLPRPRAPAPSFLSRQQYAIIQKANAVY